MKLSTHKFPLLCGAALAVLVTHLCAQDLVDRNKLSPDWMSVDVVKRTLKSLAGKDASTCGLASWPLVDASDVTDCAIDAFASNTGFYARYVVPAVDVEWTVGFAFDGKKLYAMSWERLGFVRQEYLRTEECPLPIKLVKTSTGMLNCVDSSGKPAISLLDPDY